MSIGPDALLANTYCLSEVSKDVNGQVIVLDADQKQCRKPGCETLTLLQYLRLDLSSNGCDSQLGQLLDGQWRVRNLTTTFTDLSEHSRGVHAADFYWKFTAGGVVVGTIEGISNTGIVRPPVFARCEKCDQSGVIIGHLFGTGNNVPGFPVPDFNLEAMYRLAWDPTKTPQSTAPVTGTVEGVVIMPCQ